MNHIHSHLYACRLAAGRDIYPCVGLVVSGGHTALFRCDGPLNLKFLGGTRDDAAGEAFDKAARMLGLGYPGGPALDRLARQGDAERQPLPVPVLPGLEYSFSGLKTDLLYRLRDIESPSDQVRADLAAAFERSVVESLLAKLDQALKERPVAEVVICGGVAANTLLRKRAAEVIEGRARLTIPPLELCTDNAAMIAAAAEHQPDGTLAVDPGLSW